MAVKTERERERATTYYLLLLLSVSVQLTYFSGDHSRLERVHKSLPQNLRGLLVQDFYRPDALPVTQLRMSNDGRDTAL